MTSTDRSGMLRDALVKCLVCTLLAGLFALPALSGALADTTTVYTMYTITKCTDGTADVTVTGTMGSTELSAMKTNLGSYTLDCLTINEGATYSATGTSTAVTIENYGTITDGSFANTKIYNYGLIDDASVYDVYNASSGQIIGYSYKDDGDYYYSLYIHGAIENYGTIKCRYGSTASVTVNEGTLTPAVTYNASWDYDEGYYVEVETELLGNYGARVIDSLGEGWYKPDGTSADDVVLGLSNTLYRQWTKSDGVMTVTAYNTTSSKPIIITSDMLTDVSKIVVNMGDIKGENITVPVELNWRTCSSGECYYTSSLVGGTYQDVTVTRTGKISGCTINGTLTLNKACLITEDVVLGSDATCIVNSLSTDTNMWKPSGFPYTYYIPMTIAEGGTVSVKSTFYGDVTNNGTLSYGTYHGDVLNYGTVSRSNCTFNGGYKDYSAHVHSPGGSAAEATWTRWDGSSALSLTSGDNYVALACDVTRSMGITVSGGQHLYLCLCGFDYTVSGSFTAITVDPYGELTLCSCVSGGKVTHTEGASGRGVYVDANATFTMYGGNITGNTYYSDGVGVRVAGTFIMHGGSITDNDDGGENWVHGAGVTADTSPAAFTMYGGSISGNTSERGGGVRISNGAVFNMYGGSISGNTANNLGGGLYVTGSSKVNLLGGTISGNTAANEGGGIKNGTTSATFTLGGSMNITGNALADGTVSNFDLYSSPAQLNSDFTGSVGVTKTYPPAAGSYMGFAKMADGSAVPAEMLSCFSSDNDAYNVYVSENSWAVLGHDTYTLTLTNATLANGSTSITTAPGTQVTITADTLEDKLFTGWERAADSSGASITTTEPTFTFTIPPVNVAISAVYEDIFVVEDGVLTAYNGSDTEVVIPEGVTAIGAGVFADSPVARVTIPGVVTSIGDAAFPEGTLLVSPYDAYARTWASENGCAWQHDIHTEAIIPGFEASCTEDGLTDYIFCEVCGDTLQDSVTIPAFGHTVVVTVEAAEPTCTEDGRTEGTACSVCGTELVVSEAILATGHSPVSGTGIDVTCTEDGLTAGSTCAVCTDVLEEQVVIPALGHDEVTLPGYAQTDHDAGLTDGVACERCGTTLVEQTVIPANFTYDGTTIIAYNGTATNVVIPSDATALGDTLFKNNTTITSVTVPDSVTTLGTQTFFGCTGLTDMYLPDGLTSIGAQTLYKVTAKIYVSADSATAVALSYRSCSFVTEDGLALRYRVTSSTGTPTAVWVTGYHGSATEVVIPEAVCDTPVTQIQASAFANQTQLVSVTIPASVTTIDAAAFTGVTTLTVYCYKSSAAETWATDSGYTISLLRTPEDDYTYTTDEDGNVTITKYVGDGGDVTILSELGGGKVTAIGAEAFMSCKTLTSVVIPDGVTSIGSSAFCELSSLTNVTIPDSVTAIYSYAFDSTGLTSVTIPGGVTKISSSAFQHCRSLTSVTMLDGVTEIGDYAFSDCSALTSVTMPATLTTIGKGAFSGCTNLTDVVVPEGVTIIGVSAFENCTGLTSVTLPDSVEALGSYAFENCSSLTSVVIPAGMWSIESQTFSGCTSLTSATIPDSVTSIASDAFRYCAGTVVIRSSAAAYARTWCSKNLYKWEHDVHTPVTIPAVPATCTATGLTEGSKCSGCGEIITASEEIPMLPHTMAIAEFTAATHDADGTIGAYACTVCGLTEREEQTISRSRVMQLPASLTQIGTEAFIGVNAQQITVPAGVTVLSDRAFADCPSLLLVILPDSITAIADTAFEDSAQVVLCCSASQTYVQQWANANGFLYVIK